MADDQNPAPTAEELAAQAAEAKKLEDDAQANAVADREQAELEERARLAAEHEANLVAAAKSNAEAVRPPERPPLDLDKDEQQLIAEGHGGKAGHEALEAGRVETRRTNKKLGPEWRVPDPGQILQYGEREDD